MQSCPVMSHGVCPLTEEEALKSKGEYDLASESSLDNSEASESYCVDDFDFMSDELLRDTSRELVRLAGEYEKLHGESSFGWHKK